MITDRLMSVGEWSLDLVPNAPTSTRRAFDWDTAVFVTPTRFDRSVSFATLQTTAVYAGLVRRQDNGLRKFGGPGLLGYLQTGKGDATDDVFSGRPTGFGPVAYGAFLTAMVTARSLNGLTKGTGYSATATTATVATGSYGPPVKALLDTVATATGNEYRVLPNGTIDYGVSTSLFRSTPTVAVAPGMKGADAALRVLENVQWSVSRNIDNYRNTATAYSADGTYSNNSYSASGVTLSRYGGAATYAAYSGIATLETNTHAEVDSTAIAMAAVYTSPAMDIKCSVREYCLPRFVAPGDWIWVYSVEDDLTDTANQVVFQGQTLFPKKVRCVGYTYPVESGMGVYVVDMSGGPSVTDVSDYVAWETGRDTSLELDSKPLSILDAATRSVLL